MKRTFYCNVWSSCDACKLDNKVNTSTINHFIDLTIISRLKNGTPDHPWHRHTYLASDSSSLTRLCASSNILSVAVFCSESFSFLLSILFSVWRRIYFSLSAGGRDNNSKSSSPAGQNNIDKWWDQNDAKIDINLPTCFFIRSINKRVLDNSFQVSLLQKDLKVSIKSDQILCVFKVQLDYDCDQ